jgi:Rrf2 family protein
LHLAYHYGQRTVSVAQIARDEGISPAYLEQILHALKKKKWIRSLRGPQGGYLLARRPQEVRLGALLRDLEGRDFTFAQNGEKTPKNRGIPRRAADLFWRMLSENISEVLDKTSLKEILDAVKASEKGGKPGRLTFNI